MPTRRRRRQRFTPDNEMLDFPSNGYMVNNGFFGGNFQAWQPDQVQSFSIWVYYEGISGFGLPSICNRIFPIGVNTQGWSLGTFQSGTQERINFIFRSFGNILQVQSASTKGIVFNQANHICVTYPADPSLPGNGCKMYVNGEDVTTIVTDTLPTTQNVIYTAFGIPTNFTVGAIPINTGSTQFGLFFQRPMQYLEFFNAELSSLDVLDLYNGGVPLDRDVYGRHNSQALSIDFSRVGDFFNFAKIAQLTKWSDAGDINGAPGFFIAVNIDGDDVIAGQKRVDPEQS